MSISVYRRFRGHEEPGEGKGADGKATHHLVDVQRKKFDGIVPIK
jgi:hypothetical protein